MYKKFSGKLAFLSNMYMSPIEVSGQEFTCSEALFQACKATQIDVIIRILSEKWDGYTCKKYFRTNKETIRPSWHDIKLDVMYGCLRLKFPKGSALAEQLVTVADEDLVEINTWGDVYWGVTPQGKGENYLGRLLKACKYELLEQELPEDCKFVADLYTERLTHLLDRMLNDVVLDTLLFITVSKRVWGEDVFDYSRTLYVDAVVPVTLKCKKHGFAFKQLTSSHLQGNVGCLKCGGV